MHTLRQISKWYITVIICIVFAIFAAVYFNAVAGLEKPAGIGEALQFLLKDPKSYTICLFAGSIAKLSFLAELIVAGANIIFVAAVLWEVREGYGYDCECNMTEQVISCVLSVVMAIIIGIIQAQIVSHFWVLVLTIGIVIFVIKIWADSK